MPPTSANSSPTSSKTRTSAVIFCSGIGIHACKLATRRLHDSGARDSMKIGDPVRLIGMPADLPVGDADLPTQTVFEKCIGHEFIVSGFNEIGWVELVIESITGRFGEK